MRFKITINLVGSAVIPMNYQYELSSWIYSLIYKSDSDFGNWLHETGYTNGGSKKFRLFTFSNLHIPKFEHHNDRMKIISKEISVQLSFFPVEIPTIFITGLFQNQTFSIGDKFSRATFTVKTIEKLREPDFSGEMNFKCISPILVTDSTGGRYVRYISPENENYAELLKNNLKNKIEAYEAHHDTKLNIAEAFNFDFKLQSKARSRLVTVKAHTPQQTKLRGYIFNFSINAPAEILRIGYYAGFGEKNAMGFGCVSEKK